MLFGKNLVWGTCQTLYCTSLVWHNNFEICIALQKKYLLEAWSCVLDYFFWTYLVPTPPFSELFFEWLFINHDNGTSYYNNNHRIKYRQIWKSDSYRHGTARSLTSYLLLRMGCIDFLDGVPVLDCKLLNTLQKC